MKHWKEGDFVTPTVETDHPEDPVGQVLGVSPMSGVLVRFPLAGDGFFHPDDLTSADRSQFYKTSSWRIGDTVTPTVDTDHAYDPVGTITEISEYGDLRILFPRAGERWYPPTRVTAADPSQLSHQSGD